MKEEKTFFAPAERSTKQEISKENDLLASNDLFKEIFASISGVASVIDSNRQIVYTNDDFLNLLGIKSLETILGKRPGEVVSCLHADEGTTGCGTSVACTHCGAVNAILESQKRGVKIVKETRISTDAGGIQRSLDLNVSSAPIKLDGRTYYVLMLNDISDEKRRKSLERIFFHDLLNSAGGLNGILNILKNGSNPEETRELIDLSEEASREIVEEITLQREIRAAENGEMKVKIDQVNSLEILKSAIRKIGPHESGHNKQIILADNSVNSNFETDRMLLQRVIINLIKNALEATDEGGTVTAGVESNEDTLIFWVKNESVMTKDVQLQLFQRSFSTKGNGRGIGTYSIRLLTENYLKGKVSFISNKETGTVFRITLNKKFPADIAELD